MGLLGANIFSSRRSSDALSVYHRLIRVPETSSFSSDSLVSLEKEAQHGRLRMD